MRLAPSPTWRGRCGFYRDLLGLRVLADEEIAGEALERTTGLPGASVRVVELGCA